MEHLARQFAGEGILLAGVVGSQEGQVLVETISGPVAKFGPGRRHNSASFLVCLEKGVKGDLSQGQDHTDTFQQLELAEEVRATLLKLHSGGLVGRRRASDRSRDIAAYKP